MPDQHLQQPINFSYHNQEVKQVWDAFNQGHPTRVPVQFSMNARMVVQNRDLNLWGYSWRDCFENPEARWTVELALQKWMRMYVMQDSEMGLPQKEWAGIGVYYQNCDEAAWFGCPFYYPVDDMPFVEPLLKENKGKLYDMTPPDPRRNPLMALAIEHYEYLEDKRKHVDFDGIPVGRTWVTGGGTDGPLTIACNLRGASEVAQDFYEDPKFVHDLLGFITDATIARITYILGFNGGSYPTPGWFFADDSIELISTSMYEEFVLPYHRKLLSAFSSGGPNGIHLCGRVQRHLRFLRDALNIRTFDLGFPTDMGKARKDVGPDVTLIGNIAPHLLKQGPETAIASRVQQLCESGVMEGGKFILHDGNNCAPGTPLSHFAAMYEAGKRYGRYAVQQITDRSK